MNNYRYNNHSSQNLNILFCGLWGHRCQYPELKIGAFPITGKFAPADRPASRVTLKTTYTYSRSGNYFPTLRAVLQREGDANSR